MAEWKLLVFFFLNHLTNLHLDKSPLISWFSPFAPLPPPPHTHTQLFFSNSHLLSCIYSALLFSSHCFLFVSDNSHSFPFLLTEHGRTENILFNVICFSRSVLTTNCINVIYRVDEQYPVRHWNAHYLATRFTTCNHGSCNTFRLSGCFFLYQLSDVCKLICEFQCFICRVGAGGRFGTMPHLC